MHTDKMYLFTVCLILGYERLVVVTLHRGHHYMSLDAVKEEVSGKAVEFVQASATSTKKVIYGDLLLLL